MTRAFEFRASGLDGNKRYRKRQKHLIMADNQVQAQGVLEDVLEKRGWKLIETRFVCEVLEPKDSIWSTPKEPKDDQG